jgi:hypothetical protein
LSFPSTRCWITDSGSSPSPDCSNVNFISDSAWSFPA